MISPLLDRLLCYFDIKVSEGGEKICISVKKFSEKLLKNIENCAIIISG